MGDLLKTQEKEGGLGLGSQRRWELWGWTPEVGSALRQDGPLPALPHHHLAPELLPPGPHPQDLDGQVACRWGRSSGSE